MTNLFKILTIVFLSISASCNNAASDKKTKKYYQPSSVSCVEGHYIIDTNMILSNKNLQHLINDLIQEDLIERKTYQKIPVCVKSFLDSLSGEFSIANPGEPWSSGCMRSFDIDSSIQKKTIDPKTKDTLITFSTKTKTLPFRQLAYLGIGNNLVLMKYNLGGWATYGQIVVCKFYQNRVVDFWITETGYSESASKDQLIKILKNNNDGKEMFFSQNIISL